MLAHKGEFYRGLVMMIVFIVVLVAIFSPLFKGQNGLEYLDALYNSISKGSAYYIPAVKEEVAAVQGSNIEVELDMTDPDTAKKTAALYMKSGAMVNVSGKTVKVSGDLGQMLGACLTDSDRMYHNDGQALSSRYGFGERVALYTWWKSLNSLDKSLKDQKKFKEAKVVALVKKKAVETSYNYYGIEGQKIGERVGVVIFSLVFYVVYTLWYGFAIMYMFEGYGMKLEH
jgi:hypothetical protein